MRNRPQVSLPLAVAFALVASLALAGGVLAAETTLTADLAGVTEGENPGNPDGSGSATITLDPETGEVCWDMTAEEIGAVTQSHIHTGAEGVSGGVLIPLDVDGFDGTTEGCTSDVAAADIQMVLDNPAGFYVNLHTADFPAGAIRGQLEGSSAPNTALPAPAGSPLTILGALLLALAAAIGLRAWRPIATRD
ncbi:MAG TPA: CHRD domain-containing protein [Candidatus Limnocylindria bacterium]|nr:CHRD domain-containing protein [Candidatus Limnocylindria bacterium]